MNLPTERVGPYVRALSAALDALAPDETFVPLAGALGHLRALDPVVSGELLAPAEVIGATGMPAYPWLERARAEAVLAARGADPSDDELARARALDPALGARMRDRRDLHRHLREAPLLPTIRVAGLVRSLGDVARVGLVYDRIAPDGRWVRVRAELDVSFRGGALALDPAGRLVIDEALEHLLTRHFATPLGALRAQLADAVASEVVAVSRGWLGPFWFPGVALPRGVPAELGQGLLLHASLEVLGPGVRADDLDPLEPVAADVRVDGYGAFRERRLAGSGAALEAARGWGRSVVVPIGAARPRRL